MSTKSTVLPDTNLPGATVADLLEKHFTNRDDLKSIERDFQDLAKRNGHRIHISMRQTRRGPAAFCYLDSDRLPLSLFDPYAEGM